MSDAELPNLDHLLKLVVADPAGLVDRVVARAAGQLAPDGVVADGGDEPSADVIASALGDRLARMIAGDDDRAQARDSGWLAHYQELLDRNSALAAALGACDCWGQDRGCPVCGGAGTPGWALPDERLFAAYVQPAVSAGAPPRATRTQKTQATTDNHRTTGV
jgi:hypothetical protein